MNGRHFYGKETALFSLSDEEKERAKKGLKGVLEGLEGERDEGYACRQGESGHDVQ